MKVWIEFPEETRFARTPRDILYTPIYFANEKINGHLRLDNEWRVVHGDDLDELFTARVKFIGKASLGFLSLGGKPVSGLDMRYALPNLGFKPIYTLEILNTYKRLSLAGLEYDADDGVRGGRKPFSFQLAMQTLEDLQQLASSLKVISADNVSTMGFLKGVTPALIVSVQYMLVAEVLDTNSEIKASSKEEIRIFVSLSEEQVPTADNPSVLNNPMAKFVTTQVVPIGNIKSRRGSIPLIRRLSRTSSSSAQDTSLMTIDVESAEPFTFNKNSDAAASKVTMSLTYATDTTEPPPTMYGGIQWMLKSLTTLTLEPIVHGPDDPPDQQDDFFHLRSKILPSRKLKLKWSDWTLLPSQSTSSSPRWKSTQAVWLIKDITAGMTPTFVTPYLAHTYLLNMQISLVDSESKLSSRGGLSSGGKSRVELDVPVQVRYDLGLVPVYEVDNSLPEYDHSLPEYEEFAAAGASASAEAGAAEGNNNGNEEDDIEEEVEEEEDGLPDLTSLPLRLMETRDVSVGEDTEVPLPLPPRRQLAHTPRARSPVDLTSSGDV